MPAEIIEVPLALRTRFPNGEATHHFANLPLPHLVRQLLEGLVVMCSPNGSVKSRWSACSVTSHLRSAVRALHSLGFTGDIRDLRAEHLLAACTRYSIEEV
ncbi:MAG TPA: hypothetical protein VGR90_08360, partial [Acidimicrobiales bacterium]|nr:hypothetical protein [Acidimicrobiales bacterium]